jgi:acyl-CoA hydrolase
MGDDLVFVLELHGRSKVGRTSITVKVEAFAHRGRSGEQIQVTEGVFQ